MHIAWLSLNFILYTSWVALYSAVCLSVRHRCQPTKSPLFPIYILEKVFIIHKYKPFVDPVPPKGSRLDMASWTKVLAQWIFKISQASESSWDMELGLLRHKKTNILRSDLGRRKSFISNPPWNSFHRSLLFINLTGIGTFLCVPHFLHFSATLHVIGQTKTKGNIPQKKYEKFLMACAIKRRLPP